MANDFKDLRVWQLAHKLTIEIYSLSKDFPKEEMYGLTSQLRRAAVSVEANIAESHGRYHDKDAIRFLHDARGSIYEIQSELMVAADVKYCNKNIVGDLIQQYTELARQLNSLIKYKRNREI